MQTTCGCYDHVKNNLHLQLFLFCNQLSFTVLYAHINLFFNHLPTRFFSSKPSVKQKSSTFTLGDRNSVLTEQLEAPAIVPHTASKDDRKVGYCPSHCVKHYLTMHHFETQAILQKFQNLTGFISWLQLTGLSGNPSTKVQSGYSQRLAKRETLQKPRFIAALGTHASINQLSTVKHTKTLLRHTFI